MRGAMRPAGVGGRKSELGTDESVVTWVQYTHGPRPHRAVA